MDQIILTKEGAKKLFDELNYLKRIKRPELITAIAEARRKGDLSENAEYDAVKEEQQKLETRIHKLEVMTSRVEILDEDKIPTDKAYLGAQVFLRDIETGNELYYILVNEYEADYAERKISISSPVGKSLLGKGVGDEVEVTVPRGILKYKLIKISR